MLNTLSERWASGTRRTPSSLFSFRIVSRWERIDVLVGEWVGGDVDSLL